ncbi:MAG: hypothetical protein LBU27_02555 [Candidatus Peribacteria bacterium]|nr:hypothetical protein [Candidatus Peribacteria bacterium]
MFFIASIAVYAFAKNKSTDVTNDVSIAPVASPQSFYDCWTASILNASHSFVCGPCTKYTIVVGNGLSSGIFRVQVVERDSTGAAIYSYIITVPANGSVNETIQDSRLLGLNEVFVSVLSITNFNGAACVTTIN